MDTYQRLVGEWAGNPTEAEKRVELEKQRAARDPASAWRYYKYGLSVTAYERMLIAQNGVCAICRRREPLNVDHCHLTDVVRGLLCSDCNFAIGFMEDLPARLRAAADYLEKQL